MIYGFLNNKIVSAEEYLIDYSIRTGQSVYIPTDLLNIPIIFDGKDITAFILDITDNNELVLQLVLPLKYQFDDKLNVYSTSRIRKLLNSNKFLSRFNKEFVEHIKPTSIHTADYITVDKLWLLSHEEINFTNYTFLKRNNTCKSFDAFKSIELKSYSETLLNLNQQKCYGWRLRSAVCVGYPSDVGFVFGDGGVGATRADNIEYGTNLPACIIG